MEFFSHKLLQKFKGYLQTNLKLFLNGRTDQGKSAYLDTKEKDMRIILEETFNMVIISSMDINKIRKKLFKY